MCDCLNKDAGEPNLANAGETPSLVLESAASRTAEGSGSGRLKIWEFTDRVHCPVVGTCLNVDDLQKLAKKLRLSFDEGASDYDIHAHFVKMSAEDSPEARAIQKFLDNRHAGIVRTMGRLRSADEFVERWEEMKEKGEIAGAFWALMTLRQVPSAVRARIFGDVHMLSHDVAGAQKRQGRELAALKAELEDTQRRRMRAEASLRETAEARGVRIRELEAALREARAALVVRRSEQQRQTSRRRKGADVDAKVQRALESARYRARQAEAENRALREALARKVNKGAGSRTANAVVTAESANNDFMASARRLDGHSYLYIGGRDNQFAYLRDVASLFGVELIHHDGGLTDAITRIDEVLPSVECVLCPINCVSHDACQRAKVGCKKHGKTFLPLRSASKTSLRDALIALMVEGSANATAAN